MNKKVTALVFFVVVTLVACGTPQSSISGESSTSPVPSPSLGADEFSVLVDYFSVEIPGCLEEGQEFNVTVLLRFQGEVMEETFTYTWIFSGSERIVVVDPDHDIIAELETPGYIVVEFPIIWIQEGTTEIYTVNFPVFHFSRLRNELACFELPKGEQIQPNRA